VRCAQIREALSARLDGEPELASPESVDRHVESCAQCRAWWVSAQRLQSTMVVRPAGSVPDLTATILRNAPEVRRRPRPSRVVLGVVAVAQCLLAVAQVLGLADGMHGHHGAGFMVGHLTSESTAWNLAIGVGLFWAAVRPRAAAGQLPLLTGFVIVLAGVSANDLVHQQVTTERLLSHALVVVGLVVLFLVHRQHRQDEHPHPASGDALPVQNGDRGSERWHDDRQAPPERTGGYRRPASEHRAA
jgi:predicted anti-sigma-YlaC factor YlaD